IKVEASLWPLGTRAVAIGPPTGLSPTRISSTATNTLSWALSRKARGLFIVCFQSRNIQGSRLFGKQVRAFSGESLEQVGRLLQMIVHRHARAVGIAAHHRLGDRAMFGQGLGHAAGWRQQQPPDPLQMRA